MDLKYERISWNIFVLRCTKERVLVRFEKYKLKTNLEAGVYKVLRLVNSSEDFRAENNKVILTEEDGQVYCNLNLQRNTNRHLQGDKITFFFFVNIFCFIIFLLF